MASIGLGELHRMMIVRRILATMAGLLLIVYLALVAYAYWPTPEGFPAKQLAGPSDKFIAVDGIDIRYRTWGSPNADKPAIVLIHGFANSVVTFRNIAPLLADEYYVVALDMPGFGLSGKPDDREYTNANQAYMVERFVDALGINSFIVGGHSMGGALVVHVATQDPGVVGAIMFNPGIISTGVPPATQYFVFPLPRLAAKTFADQTFRERFLKGAFINPDVVTDDAMEQLMLGPKTNDYWSGVTQLMAYYVSGDEVEMLENIPVPVLLVWGALDKGKPDGEAEQIDAMIPSSRLVLVEGAGHYVHEEAAEQSAVAILQAKDFWLDKG